MLNKNDLGKLIQELNATGDHDDIVPELEAWGINPDDVKEMIGQLAESTMRVVMRGELPPFAALVQICYIGFSLGIKAEKELEMRRLA
jgi:hypothetical protein